MSETKSFTHTVPAALKRTRTPSKSTVETAAIRKIGRVLDELDEVTRTRILAAIKALYFPVSA